MEILHRSPISEPLPILTVPPTRFGQKVVRSHHLLIQYYFFLLKCNSFRCRCFSLLGLKIALLVFFQVNLLLPLLSLLRLHLLCNISIHDFLAGLMLQLLFGCFTQAIVDHAVHIAGAALVQILFGDFAIPVVTTDLQLVHTVWMLGKQRLELVNQNPSGGLPDILVHSRADRTNHPAVTVAATNLCTNLLCFRAIPQFIPRLIV